MEQKREHSARPFRGISSSQACGHNESDGIAFNSDKSIHCCYWLSPRPKCHRLNCTNTLFCAAAPQQPALQMPGMRIVTRSWGICPGCLDKAPMPRNGNPCHFKRSSPIVWCFLFSLQDFSRCLINGLRHSENRKFSVSSPFFSSCIFLSKHICKCSP